MALSPCNQSLRSSTENPNSSRVQKPISRSSEIGDPMRRSFCGSPFLKPSIVANPRGLNPITPANSPSVVDCAARGREKMRFSREYEDKENGRESTPKKTPSKGTKNFMSSTISAASKICASPSKKILAERNNEQQPLQKLAASSDLRSSCSSVSTALSETTEESQTKVDMGSEQKGQRKKVVFDTTVHTILPATVSEPLLESDIVEGEEKSMSPDPKPPCPPPLAPLDADPLAPISPYDPKTNYLAPRPKFLYYRPRSLSQDSLDGEMDLNPLDDGVFFSGIFSETEATEETESKSSRDEPEAVSSEIMMEKEEVVSGEEILDSEAEIAEAVVVKATPRKQFLSRTKGIVSIFILLVACLAVMGATSQTRSYSVMVMEVVPREAEHLRSLLGRSFSHWRDSSLSYIDRLMSESQIEHQLVFINLTTLDEAQWLDKNNVYGSLIGDDSYSGAVLEQDVQTEAEDLEGEESDSRTEAEVEDEDEDPQEESGFEQEEKILEESELGAVQYGGEDKEVVSLEEKIPEESELGAVQYGGEEQEVISEESKTQTESKADAVQSEPDPRTEMDSSTDKIKIPPQFEAPQSTESKERHVEAVGFNDLSTPTMTAISLLVVTLVAVLSSIFFKKRAVEHNQAETQPLVAKKLDASAVSSNQMTEFGADSEISSFYQRRKTGKSSMKEPLTASSSSDMSKDDSASPSYGSFTTYEMIPSKKRNGDEELVVTPLRRSSRLKK